jgi:hypothetical protein
MSMRVRKLVGTVALIALVLSWALIGMAVAQFPAVQESGNWATLYYAVAGLGWVLPAMPLVRWMLTDNRRRTTDDG